MNSHDNEENQQAIKEPSNGVTFSASRDLMLNSWCGLNIDVYIRHVIIGKFKLRKTASR